MEHIFSRLVSQDHWGERSHEDILYVLVVGSLIYVMLCIKSNICFVVGMMSIYKSNPSMDHCTPVKHILKYLLRMRDYMLVYHCDELLPLGYIYSNFQSDKDSHKFSFGFVFTLGDEVFSWRSVKQSYVVDSTMETNYVIVFEIAKEVVWL